MRKMFLTGASLLVLSSVTPAFTNDTDKVVSATGNLLIDTINKKGIFQWVEGQFSQTSNRLEYGLTGFSVLSENKNRLQYLQTSLHRKGSVNALNLGFGIRNLTQLAGNPALVGVNLFLDTKDGDGQFWRFTSNETFRRVSLGLELKTGVFDFSANYYNPLGNSVIQGQKVLKGYDVTAKGHIPNAEFLSIGVNTYRFSGVADVVEQGNKLIAEFKPNSVLTLRGEYDKPKDGEAKTEFFTGLRLAFNKPLSEQLKPLNISGDAWAKRYDKVERQYEIRTADALVVLGTPLTRAQLTAKRISGGDGATEQSAYALRNGEQYEILDFLGTVDSSLTGATVNDNIKVSVTKISGDGKKGEDYELYASDGSNVISLSEVTADSKFTDIAGGKEAVLQFIFSANGFEDRVVFVKAEPIGPIGSVLSDSDKTSNNIKGGDGSSEANAYTLTNKETYDVKTFIGTVPAGITPTITVETVSGTSGTDFQFKNGGSDVTVANATYTSTLEDKADAGAAVIKLTYSAPKFNNRIVYVKTDSAFAGTLTMADLVVPYGGSGDITVSTTQILGKLTVSGDQTQKSDWTIKSLVDTDNNTNLTVDGAALTISGAIDTPTTVTAVFEHTDSEYADQTKTFELSTGAGTLGGTPTGVSGKWGKTFDIDYKLNTSDTVGDVTVSFDTGTDFTFTIVTGNVPSDAPSGTKATTAGILDSTKTAINATTGAIDGTALTKSGDLLVKIVRAAKGGLPALTVYENITVTKQDSSDHPNFTVSAGAIAWATASTAVTYTPANLPTGIGTATYALTTTGTTAGATTGGNAITVASSDGKIAKTAQSGVVKVNITYAANDKYAQMSRAVDVTINKQTVGAGTLSVANLVVSYVSGTKTVTAADVLGQLTATGSSRSDWSVKSLANTDSNASVAVASGGKSLTLSGALHTTTTTITVVFESTKYNDVTKTFELSTRPAQVIDGTPTGLTGKWGKGTVTPDYKLKTSDQGQTFDKATDYTFSIVPSSDGGKEGKDATTAGIVASGENAISNARTGAIDSSKLTQSGKLLIKIVRAAKGSGSNAVAAATEYVNFDVTKQVLGTDETSTPAVATATGENGKWKDSTVTKIDLDYTLPGGTRATQYTWAVAKKSSDAPDGTLNIVNGDIRGATSAGTVEITMTATASNPKYSGSIRTADFTIGKQVLGTDVTTRPAVAMASGEDGKWKSGTSAKIALNYTLPGATTVSDYTWGVAAATTGGPSGTLAVDGNGHISGATSSGTAEITITAKAANKKYSGSIRTADFAIGKQTVAANTLTVANLVVSYVSGTKTVTAADVLGQLSISSGSAKSDWTVKSLADTDSHANVAVASGGKSLTISGAITTTTTTITVVFESSKYADVTKTFELSTRPAQVIDGTPTGLSSKWGKGTVTPDYKLDLSDQGQTFDKATDYTFSIVPSSDGGKGGKDATTAGIVTGALSGAINTRTGAIDSSKLTQSGKLLIKIVRAAKTGANAVAAATEYVNFDVTKQVLGTDVTSTPAVATATGENGKWKDSTVTKIDLDYTLPGGTRATQYTWAVAKKSSDAPDGTLNIVNGDIRGATSAGTVEITMTATASNPKYSGSIRTADFTIGKQVLGTDVTTAPAVATATGEDGKWKSDTSAKIALNYTLPGATTVSDYTWGVAAATTGGPSGTLAIDGSGHISGATSSGTAEITITAKAANKKYSGNMRTADFAIAKQTVAADTLTVANLAIIYASGNKTVSAADVLGQLTISSGSTKSDWTVKSLADTDSNGNLAVASGGKALTISGAIASGTTVTVVFESSKYADVTKTFELSTKQSQISSDTPTGLSGKWGKSTVTPDYKLKTRDGGQDFDTSSDFTFTIVAAGTTVSGYTSTTTGIVNGALTGAIAAKTGGIITGRLTKSGTLLIKIDRVKKGSVDATTEYHNFTVTKQDSSDHTGFAVTAGAIAWATASTAVSYTAANAPAGIGTATYALTASGTTAGPTIGANAITVAASDGKIGKTTKGGVVKVKITYAANDKYETITRDLDVTINKQAGTGALTMGNFVIPFGATDTSKKVSTATITGKLSVPNGLGAKSEWTLKSLADTDSHSNLAETDSDKTLTISGAISPSTTVTATFESDKYTDKSATFELSTGAGAMSSGTRDGLTGKWGKGFSSSSNVDYKLKASDAVGDTTVTFTTGTASTASDYTFTIVTGAVPSDAPSGTKRTTANILDTAKTAINAKNGAIDGTALVKSGDLLVKIVRKAKGGLPALTDYQNIAVTKQSLATDITTPTFTSSDPKWKAKIPVTFAGLPTGTAFADYDWEVAAQTSGAPTGTLGVVSDGITGATSAGTVVITMKAKTNDAKYSGQVALADFAITKQTVAANTLTVANLAIIYDSGNKTVTAADVLGQLTTTGSATRDWTVKSLADTDSNGNLAVASGGKALTISGTITSGTTVTVVFESTKYTDVSKTFELSTKTSQISTATRTGSGKWGKTYTTDYKLKTREGTVTFTTGDASTASDYTFTIVTGNVPSDAPSGTKATTTGILDTAKTAINVKNGTINGDALTKSGTLLVKIVRAAKGTGANRVPAATEYENFTVSKQDLNGDITTPTVRSTDPKWGAKIPLAFTGIPTGTTFADYTWTVAPKTGSVPTGTLAVVSDGITGATSAGTVVITMKAKANDDKYEGQVNLADFPITKQAGTGALTMGNLVIPYGGSGDEPVTAATIAGKLGVPAAGGLGAKSEWTLKSLADTDSAGNSKLVIDTSDTTKAITIKGAISPSTTITATFESDKYTDKSATFKLSTGAGVMRTGTPTGITGKWGKSFNVDYKLKGSDTVGDTTVNFTTGDAFTASDYIFTIVASGGDDGSGKTPTTAGILDTAKRAITQGDGAIDGTALVKSGTLLVKIVRKAKGGLPSITDYQNITVTKQQGTDHPNFAVTAGAIAWATASTAVSYNDSTNKPAGISTSPTYALIPTGTTAGDTTGGDAITVAQNTGAIGKTTKGGVVKVRVTYPANDKYETITEDVDVPINKQAGTGTLTMDPLVIPYGGSGDELVTAATIKGKLAVPNGGGLGATGDWTLKSLADTDSAGNSKLVIDTSDPTNPTKAITIKSAISPSTTITATFESDKYTDKNATFELSTGAGVMTAASDTRMGLTGKWGKGFTAAANVDYKLKLSDTVGGATATFKDDGTTDDFTFSIVAAGGDDGSGKTQTTAGIVTGDLSGAIDDKTGAIDGTKLNKSGTLLVKIVRKAKGGLPALTDYENITVTKQSLATDITTPTVRSTDPKWGAKVPLAFTGIPTGTTFADYDWTVAPKTSGAPTGTLAVVSDGITGATSAGTVVITMKAKSTDAKYEGQVDLADFAITKQTTTDTLTMADIVIPYGDGISSPVTVDAAAIEGKMTVTKKTGENNPQTQKSDWTVGFLANKDTHGNLDVPVAGKGKLLSINGAIDPSTTVTVLFEDKNNKYADISIDFKLSTGAGTLSSDTRTGSGKWGKTFTTDYKLNDKDTVGDVKDVSFTTDGSTDDFTFSIEAPATTESGFTSTTTGIVQGALTGAIDDKTGTIDGTKLTKSGTLLVKIVRKAKGGLPTLTTYQNFDVAKQVLGTDVTTIPTVQPANGDDNTWKTDTGTKFDLAYANLPGGLSVGAFDWRIKSWTGSGTVIIDSADGKISGATGPGNVVITLIAKGDKYSGSLDLAPFTIAKRTLAADDFTIANLVVPFISNQKTVSAGDVLALLTPPTGSSRNDWSVKSLADTDSHANVAVDSGGKSLTISGALHTTTTTITVVFESTKYNDVTKDFELSTRASQVIAGTPTGLSGKWGVGGTVMPDYKLDLSDQGQTFVKATDYTFSVVPSSDGSKGGKDATTAGIFSSNPISNARTGAIDTSKLTKSGKLLIEIKRAAKGTAQNRVPEATDYVNFEVQKQVLGTDVTTAPAVATATGESGKWKSDTSAKIDLDYTLPGATTESDYTWAVDKKSGAEPDGTLAVDGSGDMSGATSSGTAEITITAKASNPQYSGSMRTADFTIAKQVLGTDVTANPAVATATGEDGTWKSSTSAKIDLDYTLPGGTAESDYTWAVGKKSGAEPSGTLAIDQTNGHISGATSSGTAEITITAKPSNKQYSGSIRTADFDIAKQTATATLRIADIVVPYTTGDKGISTADIMGQFSVTGGASVKGDWTLKSLAKIASVADNTLVIAADKKNMTIKQAISAGTTITAVFESSKYKDKTVTFDLSTRQSQMFAGVATGLTSKWGKGLVTPDYKLNSGGFNAATDYTFSVLPDTDGDNGSGLTPTTAGIFTSSPMNNIKIGQIDTDKLTKSGTLLIKIVRAKQGTTTLTEYVNFTVQKQVFGTVSDADENTVPTVALANGDNNQWKTNTATPFDMAYSNLPFSLGADDFAWEVVGKSGDTPSGNIQIDTDGKVFGATSAGTVVITVKAKANDDKYAGQFTLADFAIAVQPSTDDLRIGNFVIPFGASDTSKAVSNTAIRGKFSIAGNSKTQKSDWRIKELATLGSTDFEQVTDPTTGAKSLNIKAAINPPANVGITFEDTKNRYADVRKSFTLGTGAGAMSSQTPTGAGKWGKIFTTDYYLNTSDTVGDVTETFTTGNNGDFTFTIVPSGTTQNGKATTAGIVANGADGNPDYAAAINPRTGAIDGSKLTQGGTLLVEIVRKAKGGLPELTVYQDFTVDKQTQSDHGGFAVTAGAIEWATASKAVSYTASNAPAGISTPTYALIASDDTTAGDTTGGNAITVAQNTGAIAKTSRGGVVKVRVTYPANPKYDAMTHDVTVTVDKQTAAGTITINDIAIPYALGNFDVPTLTIRNSISITGGSSGLNDWRIKSLANTDNIGNDTLVFNSDNTLTIKKPITSATTITAVIASDKYKDITGLDFELYTSAGSMTTGADADGAKRPWGVRVGAGASFGFTAANNVDYKLLSTDIVGGVQATFTTNDLNGNSDYTFTIVKPSDAAVIGYQRTTAAVIKDADGDGIGDNDYAAAIDAKTGAIDGSNLIQSGTLLVKIVRKAKTVPAGTLPELTAYQNITVEKQVLGTHVTTQPTITITDKEWKNSTTTKFDMTYGSLPGGQAVDAFDWSVRPDSANPPIGTVKIDTDGKISGAESGGKVHIKLTAKSSDPKYKGDAETEFTIDKQTTTDTLSMNNLVVQYATGTRQVNEFTIKGRLKVASSTGAPQTQASDWTVKSLADTDSNTNLAVASGGKALTISGAITGGTTVTVTFENKKYEDKDATFTLSTQAGQISTGTARTGLSGKWGIGFTTAANYQLKTTDTIGFNTGTFDKTKDFTFTIVPSGTNVAGYTSTTPNIVDDANDDNSISTAEYAAAINAKTGAIVANKLVKSGTLLVKIVRVAKGGLAPVTEYENITVDKQELGAGKDVTAPPTLTSSNPKWGDNINIPLTFAGFPTGTDFDDYTWTVTKKSDSGTRPKGTLTVEKVNNAAVIKGALSAGTVGITMTAKAGDGNDKYTGSLTLADFDIAKRTSSDTIAVAAGDSNTITVPFGSGIGVTTQTVLATLIQDKLSVSGGQTKKDGWTVKGFVNFNIAGVAIGNDNTSLIITKVINAEDITVIFEHPDYDDKQATFKLSTSSTVGGQMSAGARTGLSGKWGKGFTTAADYKLKTRDTVLGITYNGFKTGTGGDFTFTIVPSGTTVKDFTSTTAGIVNGALTGAINKDTGAIDGSKLTKSGTVLVKIVRKALGGLPELTDYQQFTVDKQNLATDITKPTLGVPQGSNKIWRNNGGNIPVDFNGLPGGTTFGDYTWTAAGNGNKGPDVIGAGLSVTSAGIMGALSGGEVVVTMKAKAGDDKYTGQLNLATFTIDKQTIMSPVRIANIVADEPASGTTTISESDIRAKMSILHGLTQKSDWILKSLSYGGNGNLTVNGKSLTVSGAIAGNGAQVTATFENKKYIDASALFKVFTQNGGMHTDTPTGLSGAWGTTIAAPDYKLDTTGGFTTGNYTFSIVPSGTTVSGFESTTAGIVKSGQTAIDTKTGAITGANLTKSGTLLIKIARQKSDGSGSLTVHHNFIVGKQVFGTDVTKTPTIGFETGEDGKWKTSSSDEINLKYTNLPGDGSPQAANTFDWAVAAASTDPASGALKIDSEGDVRGATSGGKISITVTAKADDPKYTGKFVLADLTIKKQDKKDNLAFADMRVPQSTAGTDVSFDDLLQQLTVTSGSQTKASEWKVKGVQGSLPANITSGSNKIVVKGAHTDANVTLTLEHPKYNDVNEDIDITTISNPISTGIRTGSGKWGAGQTYSTDYKLKTVVNGVTFNKNTDYTFEIAAPSVTPTGYTATTSGIAQSGAIDAKTGAINASKLNKSGTLLVKITRADKGGLGGFEYQNFTVSKQTQADHPDFKVSAPSGFRWTSDSGSLTYPKTSIPAGIKSPTYSLIKAGTTAGTVTSSGPGQVSVVPDNGKILGTKASGIVKVRVVYPENDKYERMVFNVDVPVKRKPAPASSFSDLNFKSSLFDDSAGYTIDGYRDSSQTWGSTFTPKISGKIARTVGVDWYTPVWSIDSRTSQGSTSVGGSINQATGVITGTQSSGTITVTVTLPRNVRYEAFNNNSKTFTLTVQRKAQPARAKSGHGSWSQSNTPRIGAVQRQLSNAIENASGINVARDVKLTKFEDGSDITDGASYGTDYVLTVSFASVNSRPSMVRFLPLEIRDLRIRTISGGNFRKAIKLTFRLPASSNGKYAAKTLVTYWRTK